MSVIASKTRNDMKFSATSARDRHAPSMSAVSIAARIARRLVVKCSRLVMHAVDATAEARMQRAKLEVELYRNRYRHTSKNDDDLPIVR